MAALDKIEKLLEAPYSVIDIFPLQVPQERAEQYFSVEDYFLRPEELRAFAKKIVRVMLKLSCYYGMEIYCHEDEQLKAVPTEMLAGLIETIITEKTGTISILLANALVQITGRDLYATVYHADKALHSLLQQVVTAEGLFLREP